MATSSAWVPRSVMRPSSMTRIWFALWMGALGNAGNAIGLIGGTAYEGQSEEIYAAFEQRIHMSGKHTVVRLYPLWQE